MLCSSSADGWVALQAPAFPLLPRDFTRGVRVGRLYLRNLLQLAHHSHGAGNVIFLDRFHGLDVEICCVLQRFGWRNHLGDHGHDCSVLRGCKIWDFLDRAQRYCGITILFGELCSSTSSCRNSSRSSASPRPRKRWVPASSSRRTAISSPTITSSKVRRPLW